MSPKEKSDGDFLPALRFRALTPLFDPVVRVTTRENTLKGRLLDALDVAPGARVLDLGAGTGTLAIQIKQRWPEAHVTGLDADPDILARARHKATAAAADIEFVEGFSNELPFADGSLDVVVSTLFFHHLKPDVKRATVTEVARVLKPGGTLDVGDFGRPADPLQAVLGLVVRTFDGFENTADNVRGALPDLFRDAGLEDARERSRLRGPLGSMSIYTARKPA